MTRKLLTFAATTVMFLGLLAAPAVADEPTEVNLGDFMYTHVNPCTGLEHDLYFENVT
jgi:hypothetical protein